MTSELNTFGLNDGHWHVTENCFLEAVAILFPASADSTKNPWKDAREAMNQHCRDLAKPNRNSMGDENIPPPPTSILQSPVGLIASTPIP